VGQSVPAGTLASWIDEAQEEISVDYGKRIRLWYPRQISVTTADINAAADVIPIENGASVPLAPDYVILGVGSTIEKVSYLNVVGNSMVGVERGVHGTTANIWAAGTQVSLPADAGVEHDLPDDLFILHEVRDIDNFPVMAYQVDAENKILFFNDGAYRIIYTPTPERIDPNDNASMPVVHSMFHNLLLIYCQAKHWQKLAEGIPGEEQKAITLLSEFAARVSRVGAKLRANENQNYEIGMELW